MPLPMPNLDDRHFQDLVDEAKRRIPHYCPEWTDHNVHDPGVTLIELFAGIVDSLIYRVNRVPEKNYIAFMNLMGLRLDPPAPAQVDLTFWLSAPTTDPVAIPAGTEVETRQTIGQDSIRFSTDTTFLIYPPRTNACLTSPDERTFTEHTHKIRDGIESFMAFSPVPRPGDAFYLADEQNLSGHIFAVALEFDPIEGLGIIPERPPLQWEAWCEGRWQPAELEADETRGLNQRGRVIVHLPRSMQPRTMYNRSGYWVRCRCIEPRDGIRPYSASPRIRRLAATSLGGTVPATHATTITNEVLGRSNGQPGQIFQLEYRPVLPRDVEERIEVQDDQGIWETWEERDDFGASLPRDPHYTLDSVSGEVAFGPLIREPDGTERQYGRVPPSGNQIRFRRYRTGGGTAGNVGAETIDQIKTAVPYIDRVINRGPARGGRDAERLQRAMVRAPLELRTSVRAVTAEDYEHLTRKASPLVHRAACIQPRGAIRPGGDTNAARSGVVRVLVIPTLESPDRPIALDELRPIEPTLARTIEEYLDRRRLLTTTLVIGPPEYTVVSVEARLKAARETLGDTLVREALGRLYRFLNPIVGGPDGGGWPFGRDLYLSEVYAVLQSIPGLAYIEQVRLLVGGQEQTQVRLTPETVIASGEHRITTSE
jgi:predicted phage baseplate assembly protein